MAKERDKSSGRYVEKATLDDVTDVFDAVEGPPVVTSADVADATNLSRDSARRKLETLCDQGRVDKRKTAGRVLYWRADATQSRERTETPVQPHTVDTTTKTNEPRERSEGQPHADSGDAARGGERATEPTGELAALVTDAVDAVADSWDDDDRLEDRKAAARAVVEYAVETGEYVGESTAVEQFRDEYPVDGQNATTWWRQNAREVLSDVGEYSRGHGGYRADAGDLEAFLDSEPTDSGVYDPTDEFDT